LRRLGKSPQGPQDIFKIAQTRYNALNLNVPMQTSVHDVANGGGHVKKHDGSGSHDPSKIDSPFPLP
jgi:hypothetical protein